MLSELDIPSRQSPGELVKPWAMSWALMYWILDVGIADSDEVFENKEPNSDGESVSAHWTDFFGVVAMVGKVGL
jgi:hypothetical protein